MVYTYEGVGYTIDVENDSISMDILTILGSPFGPVHSIP